LAKGDGAWHNTDLEGFAAPLVKALGPRAIANIPAIIYGTGGASWAVIGALLSLGCPEIRLCGRTDASAESVVKDFNVPSLYAVPWDMRHDGIGGAGVIVNASAAGMKGYPALDVDLNLASPGALVYDLIYTPRMTPLLKSAQAQGLPIIGGLDMLIAQARPSFKLFFGQAPPEELDPTNIILRALGT